MKFPPIYKLMEYHLSVFEVRQGSVFTMSDAIINILTAAWQCQWMLVRILTHWGLVMQYAQIARFMGSTWGPSGSDRTQVGPMLAPWTLLSGCLYRTLSSLVQVMACCLFGTKPLPEPMMTNCQYDPEEKFQWYFNQNSVMFIQGNEFQNEFCKICLPH